MFFHKKTKEMTFFQSETQFSQKYNIGNFARQRSCCPIFSLIVAQSFMNDGDNSTKRYSDDLDKAVKTYCKLTDLGLITKYMNFEDLINLTNLSSNYIGGTTTELVFTGELGFDFFLPIDKFINYCVIFLKDSNFFTITVDQKETKTIFSVRDCHRDTQYSFHKRDHLINHLNSNYRFSTSTVIDGLHISEFDNIEFFVIDTEITILGN